LVSHGVFVGLFDIVLELHDQCRQFGFIVLERVFCEAWFVLGIVS